MRIVKQRFGLIYYYQAGTDPVILFLSGMHGDEHASIGIFTRWLEQYGGSLPGYVYIPEVSPSAVREKTRTNSFGNDINRQFLVDTQDPEARAVMELIRQWQFSVCIDIHEDPDRSTSLYIYDSGRMSPQEREAYVRLCTVNGIALFTGIDDPDDEMLGSYVENGYYSFQSDWLLNPAADNGFSSKWMVRNNAAARVFTVEIPGKAQPGVKELIIRTVIPFLVTHSLH